ncbi:MAG: 2-amino-4-deoxychorismate dehydrogenase [Syntrophomonadaceae bacterium]|nr:2-amino-4-deoxychorismate dehydrogenase [Bacillota bacterium]
MKILALCGSHRKGKNTSRMLQTVLREAASLGAETELVELTDYEIKECISCNKCLRRPECVITDDGMNVLYGKLLRADGIVIGSPVYFGNVSGRLKDFIDRSRPLHMVTNALDGKAGAAVVHAGLRNGGQEMALQILHYFMLSHGLQLVSDRRPGEAIVNVGTMATMFDSYDGIQMKFKRGVEEDAVALASCRSLGRNIVAFLKKKCCR